jgi:hypothetical protein
MILTYPPPIIYTPAANMLSLNGPDVSAGTTSVWDEEAGIVSGLEWSGSEEERKQMDSDTGRVW